MTISNPPSRRAFLLADALLDLGIHWAERVFASRSPAANRTVAKSVIVIWLSGGGVCEGQVYGGRDNHAEYPNQKPDPPSTLPTPSSMRWASTTSTPSTAKAASGKCRTIAQGIIKKCWQPCIIHLVLMSQRRRYSTNLNAPPSCWFGLIPPKN